MGTRIYVGNLPYSADSAQLSLIFSVYGHLVDARVITDRNSGQSKRFAFVEEMGTEESARRAIAELNGTARGRSGRASDAHTSRWVTKQPFAP